MGSDYHLAELEVARDERHPSHILPPSLSEARRVLDIGCGIGQTLIVRFPDRVSFGIDIDLDALKRGNTRPDAQNICFVCGKAEALPWANAEFDLVIARVSLIYTNFSDSMREIHRVLKKDGRLWMTLQTLGIVWKAAVRTNSAKGWIWFGYVLLNSALFHFTQKQFAFRGKYESFQTKRGVRRALLHQGFRNILIDRGKHFLVTATNA